MTTLLISDLHLHPGAPEITDGLLTYLEQTASKADALYILGDFFEAWVGDDILDLPEAEPSGNAGLVKRVAKALNSLSSAGTAVYLMHGNRDFLMGKRFADACRATLLDDPTKLDNDGEPILLMHGDSLCTRDEAYMAFRAQARDPQWQAQILAMSIPERLALAKQIREQSGDANSNKAEDIMDVTPDEVVKAMKAHGAALLIHGHTHRPAIHDLTLNDQPAIRIVLGDWQPDQGWDIRLEAGKAPELRDFPLDAPPSA
ncbi:UDP-2,3-diacylglucosamine hydrolase [Onishia taeanensis]|uniref:UDP-2,3-diacylglucosamine hydrolase n=1 Tax=Onishia taeanensis TaxID=284577 RepID=A0A328XI02_9GAMM|nr:UDP-2,3-diacylglucosamine diphosphatase [Halomonas taeanensis]RAR59046.1 UDP-2,3-diacylglucosamine hydrolase [Halomonas taeanensis]